MAEYRTFAKSIVLSDDFISLPMAARYLYFNLCMVAYNKGIVINAKSTAKCIGVDICNIKTLVDRKYLIPIEDEHYQITHWYENNGIGETAKKRNNYTYRKWRESVLIRDNYKCTNCGAKENLQVHHIKPFALYPELRFQIDNGITLCRSCHKEIHANERRRQKLGKIV